MLAVLNAFPWLAAFPAAGLAALSVRSRRRATLLAAIAWGAYLPYEYGMYLRILCSGECNIRVDLLLIWPALLILGLWGLVQGLRRPAG